MTTIHSDGLAALPQVLESSRCRRVLVITGPSRRHVDGLLALLGSFTVEVFSGARQHVPAEVVSDARAVLERFHADAVVTLGGGSTTGLGKALAAEQHFTFVAIPTTYSGSEQTSIYGVTEGGRKRTRSDARVKPLHVIHDPVLTADMPKVLTVTSLMNSLAHPVSVLSTGNADETLVRDALTAISRVFAPLETLVRFPEQRDARRKALLGAGLAASVFEQGGVGAHHRLAHLLGGRFGLEHSALHAVLLPHTLRALRDEHPALMKRIEDRLRIADVEGALFDFLVRAEAPLSLRQMGVEASRLEELRAERGDLPWALLEAALHGRRPSAYTRYEDWGARQLVSVSGPPVEQARRVVVALHGRGGTADGMSSHVLQMTGNAPDVCVVAPQAPGCAWYSGGYGQSREQLGEDLAESVSECAGIVERVVDRATGAVVLAGFSQGACLALEVLSKMRAPLGGVVALSGAAIGGASEPPSFPRALASTPVLLGVSERDSWVSAEDVDRTAAALADAGCAVTVEHVPGARHTRHARHRILARPLLTGCANPRTVGGFATTKESESLPGALPLDRNSPRRAPYGLYPEQVNVTGFTAPRCQNRRTWMYRIRPSAQHSEFRRIEHATFNVDFGGEPPEANLIGFRPLPLPDAGKDFVDGTFTLGGAGDPSLRRGYAVHVYACNRNMEDRSLCNADGDLLVLPESGGITLMTELGVMDVDPGALAVVPRGLRFSVLLRGPHARGYVAEAYGAPFVLPERGPAGANGLAESRHFRAPSAWHEDRLAPGYRITQKLAGALYEATQDHSPYDVVAWHGNATPCVYDLSRFSPLNSARFDHADPSIYTVLSAPLDEPGAHCLDLVAFVPRWDPTEGTFRPPFFHRNVTTELNGIIAETAHSGGPFVPGCFFLTPSFTPHGVLAPSVERALSSSDARADAPHRTSDDALWFQLESALPFRLSPRLRDALHRDAQWFSMWGAYRAHFDPRPPA